MIRSFTITLFLLIPALSPALSYGSILTDNWLTREYKEFRIYPRIDRAYKKIEEGDNEAAIALLRKVVEIAPGNFTANSALLELCLHTANYQCVIETSTAWQTASPHKGLTSYYLALAYYDEGKIAKSIDSATAALQSQELKSERYSLLFNTLLQALITEGRVDEVLSWVKKAKQNHTLLSQSKVLDWAGQLVERGFYFNADQLLLELPQNAQVIDQRATLFEKWGKYEQAASILQQQNEPGILNNARYWLHLAQLNQKASLFENEFRALREGISHTQDNEILYRALFNRLIGMAKLHDAVELANTALEQHADPLLRSQLITLLSASKQYEAAITQVKILLQQGDADHKLQKQLAYFLDRSKKWDELGELMATDYTTTGNYKSLLSSLEAYRMVEADHKRLEILERAFPFSNVPISHRDDLTMELIQLYRIDNSTSKAVDKIRYLAHQKLLSQSLADRLLNAAQESDRCDLAIVLAERQMKLTTATSRTYKVAGYCLQKHDKPGLALSFLQTAQRKSTNESDRTELLRSLGYLAAEVNRPELALSYWRAYLMTHDDIPIILDSLRLRLSSDPNSDVGYLLSKLQGAKLTPNQMAVYLVALSYHAKQQNNFIQAKILYETAIPLSPKAVLWHQLAEIEMKLEHPLLAIAALDRAISLHPNNSVFLAERGYLKESIGDDAGAVADFKASQALVPDRLTLTPEIAHGELRIGNRAEALVWFHKAIDESIFFPHVPDDHTNEEQRRFGLKRTVQTLEDKWTFSLAALIRLDSYNVPSTSSVPPIAFAGYGGFYSGDAAYRFDDLPGGFQNGKIQVYARALTGTEDQSLEFVSGTLTGGVGVRYRPIIDQNIFLTGERVLGIGSETEDDWMLRLSGNYSGGEDYQPLLSNWMYWETYGDLAYTTNNSYLYVLGNINLGWQFKVNLGASPGSTIVPYLTTGYSSNNGNEENITVDRFDLGLGVGLFSWHLESQYRASGLRSRLRLEGRTKYAGKAEDDHTVRLIWELFF